MSIALQESSSAPELPDQAALVPYRWMREFKSYYGLQKDFELKLHNCSTFSFCVKIPNELFCRRLSVSQLRNAVRQRTLYFLNLYSSSQCLFATGGLCLGLLQRGHVHPSFFPFGPSTLRCWERGHRYLSGWDPQSRPMSSGLGEEKEWNPRSNGNAARLSVQNLGIFLWWGHL